jgi:Tol biopolymer transport system component/DNA-binding winged helix-turn-helix (wHTH) protein
MTPADTSCRPYMKTDRVSTEPRCYQFGACVMDPRKRLLWRGLTLTPLTSKAFEILLVLVENRGRVVGKSEMLELVWQQTAVEDNTLTRHISTLRKALQERPEDHQYILTVPGRGYQFVGDVVELDERPADLRVDAHPIPLDVDESLEAPVPVAPAARTGGHVRRLRGPVALGVGLLAILTGTLVLATFRLRPATVARPERGLRQFTFQSGLQKSPTWSPDGRALAFISDRAGNSDLWIQPVNEPQATQITTSAANESEPDWSPDGQSLVFRSESNGGGLFVVAAKGGPIRQIANFGYKPRWSPDSKLVLFSSSGHWGGTPRFHIVNANGGEPRALPAEIFAGVSPLHVAWRPDGRAVSVWGRDAKEQWTLLTSSIDGGPAQKSSLSPDVERRFLNSGVVFERFEWDRSGMHLFFEGSARETRSLWRITVDPRTLAWIGGPERLTSGTTADEDLAVSPDATRVAFAASSRRTRLWAFPFDPIAGTITGAGQPVTSGGAGEQDADTPDDGSKLVYRAMRGGRQEVWERTVADGRERLLVSSGEWTLTRPRWSADGTHLAYLRRRANASGLSLDAAVAVFAVDRGQERLLTRPGNDALVPSDWSSDGRTLLGGCYQQASRRVGTCLLDVRESNQPNATMRVLAVDPGRHFYEQRFSPDQRWISFISVSATDAGVSTVCVMPAAGGPWRAVTDGREYDDKPHWAPDGRTLYFVSHRDGALNVWGRRFDAAQGTPIGAPFQVTTFSGPRQMISPSLSKMQIALTADRLFLPITETQSEVWILDNVDR